jgi:hypothetical protein
MDLEAGEAHLRIASINLDQQVSQEQEANEAALAHEVRSASAIESGASSGGTRFASPPWAKHAHKKRITLAEEVKRAKAKPQRAVAILRHRHFATVPEWARRHRHHQAHSRPKAPRKVSHHKVKEPSWAHHTRKVSKKNHQKAAPPAAAVASHAILKHALKKAKRKASKKAKKKDIKKAAAAPCVDDCIDRRIKAHHILKHALQRARKKALKATLAETDEKVSAAKLTVADAEASEAVESHGGIKAHIFGQVAKEIHHMQKKKKVKKMSEKSHQTVKKAHQTVKAHKMVKKAHHKIKKAHAKAKKVIHAHAAPHKTSRHVEKHKAKPVAGAEAVEDDDDLKNDRVKKAHQKIKKVHAKAKRHNDMTLAGALDVAHAARAKAKRALKKAMELQRQAEGAAANVRRIRQKRTARLLKQTLRGAKTRHHEGAAATPHDTGLLASSIAGVVHTPDASSLRKMAAIARRAEKELGHGAGAIHTGPRKKTSAAAFHGRVARAAWGAVSKARALSARVMDTKESREKASALAYAKHVRTQLNRREKAMAKVASKARAQDARAAAERRAELAREAAARVAAHRKKLVAKADDAGRKEAERLWKLKLSRSVRKARKQGIEKTLALERVRKDHFARKRAEAKARKRRKAEVLALKARAAEAQRRRLARFRREADRALDARVRAMEQAHGDEVQQARAKASRLARWAKEDAAASNGIISITANLPPAAAAKPHAKKAVEKVPSLSKLSNDVRALVHSHSKKAVTTKKAVKTMKKAVKKKKRAVKKKTRVVKKLKKKILHLQSVKKQRPVHRAKKTQMAASGGEAAVLRAAAELKAASSEEGALTGHSSVVDAAADAVESARAAYGTHGGTIRPLSNAELELLS